MDRRARGGSATRTPGDTPMAGPGPPGRIPGAAGATFWPPRESAKIDGRQRLPKVAQMRPGDADSLDFTRFWLSFRHPFLSLGSRRALKL